MKVISIKEPWASLIKNNIKKIETRSFKTNYRGKIYIHASKKEFNQKDENIQNILSYLKNKTLSYGHIICEAELVDCIYMDKDFLEEIKKNKIEYSCGHYEEGRYAWILENIKPLKKEIPAKGQLGIWNYNKE